jgi:hypothetical protein
MVLDWVECYFRSTAFCTENGVLNVDLMWRSRTTDNQDTFGLDDARLSWADGPLSRSRLPRPASNAAQRPPFWLSLPCDMHEMEPPAGILRLATSIASISLVRSGPPLADAAVGICQIPQAQQSHCFGSLCFEAGSPHSRFEPRVCAAGRSSEGGAVGSQTEARAPDPSAVLGTRRPV